MKPIISVENLSKQYRIGTKLPYKTFMKALCCNSASFRETLMNVVTSPAKLFRYPMPFAHRSMQPSKDGYIWALKDVSFDVQQGEVLGIIG